MNDRTRLITIISFLVSGLGLAIELLAFIPIPHSLLPFYDYVSFLGHYVYLRALNFDWFYFYNSDTRILAGYFNILFYAIMLAASFFYWRSNQRETRLLRFSFSVITMSAAIGFLNFVISVAVYYDRYAQENTSWIRIAVISIRLAVIAVFAFWILKELNKTKALSFYHDAAGEETLHATPNKQRFFHLIMDFFICFLIFSSRIYLFGEEFLESVSDKIGERSFILLSMIFFRLVYYVLFETLLGTSPAKLLTESRVVNFDGTAVKFPTVITRTLFRFVPFEPFSFFGRSGWHDAWSETGVVKEVRTGVPASRYLWIFPIVIGLAAGSYFGYEAYKDHREYLREKNRYELEMHDYEYEINHLSAGHFIRLKDTHHPYVSDITYLKVDSVHGDEATVSVFVVSEYGESPIFIERYFREHPLSVDRQTIKVSSLLQGIPMDYEAHRNEKSKGVILLDDKKPYIVEQVFMQYAPLLEMSYGSSYRESVHIEIRNYGWPGTVTAIRNLEGETTWTNEIPFVVNPGNEDYPGYSSFRFEGAHTKPGDYKFEFTVVDSYGRESAYIIEGKDSDCTLRKKSSE